MVGAVDDPLYVRATGSPLGVVVAVTDFAVPS